MSALSEETIRRTRGWAVAVLLIAGANGLLFNLHHALHLEGPTGTPMPTPLAIAFGSIPVVLAGGMSVIAAQFKCGRFLKTLIWAVVLGTISLSVVAQYDVLIDYLNNKAIALIYPIVGDVATIVALEVFINPAKTAKVLDKLQAGEHELAAEAPAEPAPAAFVFSTPVAEGAFVEAAPAPAPVAAVEVEPVIETVPAAVPEPVAETEPAPAPAAVGPVAEVPYSEEELDQALLIDAKNYDETGRRASADLLAKEMRIGLRKARALRDRIKARPVQDRDADLEVES